MRILLIVNSPQNFKWLTLRKATNENMYFMFNLGGAEGACWNWWSQNRCDFADDGCIYWAEWTVRDNETVEFKVMAKINIDTTWVAIGFSNGQTMVSFNCLSTNIRDSWFI